MAGKGKTTGLDLSGMLLAIPPASETTTPSHRQNMDCEEDDTILDAFGFALEPE
jgi:hypothetical protein